MSARVEEIGDGPGDRSVSTMSFPELVGLVAATFALNSLAIDMMLPALGIIGRELAAPAANDRQLVVTVYVIGNGAAQLFFGPLVDRYGRRRVILASLLGYALGSLLSITAGSFSLLLAARAFQGVSTAATRVALIAIVRDLTEGRRMAQVMSLAVTIFMAAPILAPSFGQLVLFAAPWRSIFIVLLVYGLILATWIFWRLPETLAAGKATSLAPRRIAASYIEFLSNRISLGYTLIAALAMGALFGYISTSEQIFVETFKLGAKFPIAFAGVAGALAAANLTNARLVQRYGMRRLCHAALVAFTVFNIMHLAIVEIAGDTLPIFLLFTGLSFFCMGFIGSNSSALAMQPMGHIAGAAAAANGFAGTTLAGFLGLIVGRFYDGTTTPVVVGLAVLGLASLVCALIAERGKLFSVGVAP